MIYIYIAVVAAGVLSKLALNGRCIYTHICMIQIIYTAKFHTGVCVYVYIYSGVCVCVYIFYIMHHAVYIYSVSCKFHTRVCVYVYIYSSIYTYMHDTDA